jgi:RNA polymerase subunit RPABC4/transcription elongation factor Spt4
MEVIMCRSCGEFTPAKKHDDSWVPMSKACPECGRTEFRHPKSDTVVQTAPEE